MATTTKVDFTTQLKDQSYTPLVVTDAPFGAKGDGIADDTVAIQTALFAGAGREVHFPKGASGKYLISPGEFDGFRVLDKTKVTMDPDAQLVVSPTSGAAGQYQRVFQCMSADGCADATFIGINIDHQSQLNPAIDSANLHAHRRTTIWWQGVTNGSLIVDGLHVVNSISGNDILVTEAGDQGGTTQAGMMIVRNCTFKNMGGGLVFWDSSVINGHAHFVDINHNTVEAVAFQTNQAQTAIEVYGVTCNVCNNSVQKYSLGIFANGVTCSVCDNNIITSDSGIQLDSIDSVAVDANFAAKSFTVTGNNIRCAISEAEYVRYSRPLGIGFYTLSVDPVDGFLIDGNVVKYDVLGYTVGRSALLDSNSIGIGFFTTDHTHLFSNVKISNNIIINAPFTGIGNATQDMLNWEISNNLIVNAGCFLDPTRTQYRYPIRIDSPSSNALTIRDNEIIDNNATSIMQYAINLRSNAFPNTYLANNRMVMTGDKATFLGKYNYDPLTISPVIRDTLGLDGSAYTMSDPVVVNTNPALTLSKGGISVLDGTGLFTKLIDSAQLLVNPTFTGGTGWTTTGSGWTFGSGAGVATAASSSALHQSGIVVAGHTYRVSFTVSGWASPANADLVLGFGNSQNALNIGGNGTYTITVLVTDGTSGYINFSTSVIPVTCNITNASVYERLPTDGISVGDKITAVSGRLNLAGAVISAGTQSVTGTGVSAQVGGANSGKFSTSVTGTTTVTITPGATAPNAWFAVAFNLTTPATAFLMTASNATTITMAGTTVAGDVISWFCMGF